VALVVAGQEPYGSVSVPDLECFRFVLALAMRPLHLEHDLVGGNDVRGEPARERLLQLEPPMRGALLDEPREALLPGLPV